MRSLAIAALFASLFTIAGCGDAKPGVVAEPGDYDAYLTPPGAMEESMDAAQSQIKKK
ncbi:hypothetical protein Poly51_11290 [Rubripirellula tenax]|uniref:Secreted protein n=1 Tax=Rubripirellula tenax TaxID=2528015 RepID=A0A5C6FH95_9BACT|nr:hypothetical protein [Rubripirellula tenax]TWU60848.1 hypothetical protein Poly51_11290 [Rubripirellula tenax]